MNFSRSIFTFVVALGLASPAFVAAHHPFAATYDSQRIVPIAGVATRLEWGSPHVRLYLDVKGARGLTVNWLVEIQPPALLVARGWPRESFLLGKPMTVEGHPARNGNPVMQAVAIVGVDGRRLFLER